MRLATLVTLALLPAVVLADVGHDESIDLPNGLLNPPQDSLDKTFKMPTFLSFDWFTKQYHKHYPSMVSVLVHNKNYLASLMKVFTQGVKYRQRQAGFYMEVNEMSDWTQEERDILTNGINPGIGIDKVVNELPSDLKMINLEAHFKASDESDYEMSRQRFRQLQREVAREDLPDKVVTPIKVATGPISSSFPGLTFLGNVAETFGIIWAKKVPKEDVERLPEVPNNEDQKDGVYSDLRNTKCLTKPRNQGACGSCFIFAAITVFEFQHCIETGQQIAFSEQYVMDCGGRAAVSSCNGGLFQQVLRFTREYGLEKLEKYPYMAAKGTCPWPLMNGDKSMGRYVVDDVSFYKVRPEHVDRYLMKYPLVIGLNAPPDLTLYGGGVHNPGKHCRVWHGHAMVAVGHGRQDGRDYYLIRNSWGRGWGESGYYKLDKRSVKDCIEDEWIILSGNIDGTPFIRGLNPNYKEELLENHDQSPVNMKSMSRMKKSVKKAGKVVTASLDKVTISRKHNHN